MSSFNDLQTVELEKQAKMHLEEELNATIDEKLEHIEVLQTQVKDEDLFLDSKSRKIF